MKPHQITASSFKPSTTSEVPLTSYMLQVAKKFDQPEKSLILPSVEVNVEDTIDKSLSMTTVHHVSQSKAKTNKRPKKKKIQSSSDPKVSKDVRVPSLKKLVAETQHVEETLATADATHGIHAYESEKELGNQPKTTEAKKKAGSLLADKELTKANLDLESMLDDEIELVSGLEANTDNDEENHSEHIEELSKTDEATTNNIMNGLVDMADSKDAPNDKPAKSDPLVIFRLISLHFLPKWRI
ncbi:hypothetical protein Tco_0968401 [Tanacetum coccineum]